MRSTSSSPSRRPSREVLRSLAPDRDRSDRVIVRVDPLRGSEGRVKNDHDLGGIGDGLPALGERSIKQRKFRNGIEIALLHAGRRGGAFDGRAIPLSARSRRPRRRPRRRHWSSIACRRPWPSPLASRRGRRSDVPVEAEDTAPRDRVRSPTIIIAAHHGLVMARPHGVRDGVHETDLPVVEREPSEVEARSIEPLAR